MEEGLGQDFNSLRAIPVVSPAVWELRQETGSRRTAYTANQSRAFRNFRILRNQPSRTLAWDEANRLSSVVLSGNNVTFGYGPDG